MAKSTIEPSKKSFPTSVTLSELEKNAVELLVQLSGSSFSNSDFNDTSNATEESDGKNRAGAVIEDDHRDDQVSSSSSSSPSSFSKYNKLLSIEEEDEEGLGARKRNRFRSISELYQLTEPINLLVVNHTKRKRTY